MTTDTSAELKLFRDTSKAFVEARASVPAVRALWKEDRSFDRDWWAGATELGWTSLLVPEDQGGGSVSGAGVVDLVMVAGLLGAHAAPGPLHPVSAVIAGLTHPAAREHPELLDALMAGDQVATWAVQATRSGWDPLAPAVTASPGPGGGWKLDGAATAVELGAESDVILVVARTPQGVVEIAVPVGTAGVTVSPTGSIDMVRTFADVVFSGAEVGGESLVADESAAPAVIAHQARVLNLLQVAEAVGAVERVFEFTVQWGFDRYSFGRPLVSYQALKHRYADNMLWLQACQAVVVAAAQAVQDGSAEADLLVSSAKAYVGDRGVQVVQDCGQLHGGLSQTMDHDLNVYLRRVMLARQLYGTPREHRARVAEIVLGRNAA